MISRSQKKLINMNMRAIKHYGIRNQLKHFNTEVFELNETIIGDRDKSEITSEVADVMNLLCQIVYEYELDSDEIEKHMISKMERQMERIDEETESDIQKYIEKILD